VVAIITILDHITNLLVKNPYVVVIAIDFTKAFDTFRHATIIEKLAVLNLPDNVCNWVSYFFSKRSCCTIFLGETSSYLEVSASIIQDSATGCAMYVVTAANLSSKTSRNEVCKYADDKYLIIPASNVDS
jgi:Reverse transcriptase (RNA-dependent DNA polymerase)